jgi:hypothetical protein
VWDERGLRPMFAIVSTCCLPSPLLKKRTQPQGLGS